MKNNAGVGEFGIANRFRPCAFGCGGSSPPFGTKRNLKMNEEKIDELKKDLSFQLKFEHMNWDYFMETVMLAKKLADKNNLNFLE